MRRRAGSATRKDRILHLDRSVGAVKNEKKRRFFLIVPQRHSSKLGLRKISD